VELDQKLYHKKKDPTHPKPPPPPTATQKEKGITSNIAPKIEFPKTHLLISLLFSQSIPMQLLKTNDNSK
jgi:hypothetical protein